MIPPKNIVPFESELAVFWFDNDGILYSKSKQQQRTIEALKKDYEFLKRINDGKKVCLLADATKMSQIDKETRNYIDEQLPNYFNAIALISKSMLGYFITNVYLTVKKQPIPIKFFKSQKEAVVWLKTYM